MKKQITAQHRSLAELVDLPPVDNQLGQAVFAQCFGIRQGESVVVVTDQAKKPEAAALLAAATMYTDRIELIELAGMTGNAQEPPAEVTAALRRAAIGLLVTNYSLSHTQARHQACAAGARIASLPGITMEMMQRTLSADYDQIERDSQQLARLLTGAHQAVLTSPAGTALTLSLGGRAAIADTGKLLTAGAFGNLPAGEAFLAPVEGTTQGRLVIDGSLADIALDAPVRIDIQDGVATRISGGVAAQQLKAAMIEVGAAARIVAELGVGTNPLALVEADVLESEKAWGTCHVAFGNNAGFGGTNQVMFHSDGVIRQPTLMCDGQLVVKDGQLLL